MIKVIDFTNIYLNFAAELEQHYRYGCTVSSDDFWEVVDECFISKEFQDYKSLNLFDGYCSIIFSERAEKVFSNLMYSINLVLDATYFDGNRFTIPTSVYYLGEGQYRVVHSGRITNESYNRGADYYL